MGKRKINIESVFARVFPGGDANGAEKVDWEGRASEWVYRKAVVDFLHW